MNSGRAKIAILLGFLLLLLIAGGGAAFYYLGDQSTDDGVAEKSESETDGETGERSSGDKRVAKKVNAPELSKAEQARRDALKRREAAIKARARQKKEAEKNARETEEGEEGDEGEEGEDEALAGQDEAEPETEETADDPVDAKTAEARRLEEAKADRQKAAEEASAAKKKNVKRSDGDWKSAVLQVVTNFDKADITINGIAYPEYLDPGEPEGVVLPAGGPYDVRVTYNGNTKAYRVNLRPDETRLLMVELTGFSSSGKAPPPTPRPPPKREAAEEKKEEKKDEEGKVTVYSKPSGTIIIDGNKQSEKTPGTVEVANGRHEVQVEYEHGEMSEKKIIRVRQGSRIKLFFRARNPPK